MELKSYQKKVIADLTRYLKLLNETKSDTAAFRLFWQEKSAPALGRYQNVIPGVPNLCFKVPTGGGKTFIACNAVRPIFDAPPPLSCLYLVSAGCESEGIGDPFLQEQRTEGIQVLQAERRTEKKSKQHTGGFILKKSPEA